MPPTTQTLLEQTRDLLRKDTRRLSDIARDTGLPYHWLRNLKFGRVTSPGIVRVEQLKRKLQPDA